MEIVAFIIFGLIALFAEGWYTKIVTGLLSVSSLFFLFSPFDTNLVVVGWWIAVAAGVLIFLGITKSLLFSSTEYTHKGVQNVDARIRTDWRRHEKITAVAEILETRRSGRDRLGNRIVLDVEKDDLPQEEGQMTAWVHNNITEIFTDWLMQMELKAEDAGAEPEVRIRAWDEHGRQWDWKANWPGEG